jgi:hypothetical protein
MADNQLKPHSKDELQTSGAAKDFAYKPAPAHPGMMHTAQTTVGDITVGGASRTQSARLLGNDQVGEVHGGGETGSLPKTGKEAAPIHPGMRKA